MICHQMAKEKVIVDDDQMIRWTVTEALRNWNYACVETGTVAAALHSKAEFDLLDSASWPLSSPQICTSRDWLIFAMPTSQGRFTV
jgi:hypothetical protein